MPVMRTVHLVFDEDPRETPMPALVNRRAVASWRLHGSLTRSIGSISKSSWAPSGRRP